jgi:hypothetical protein
MGKADLQIHSSAGDGLDSFEQILEHVETRTDLDVIALTDHDDIRPAMALRDLASRRGARVEIVVGIEVTTRSGHLLALFVEDDLPMLRPLRETVRLIHERGGLAVVPHPLSYLTFSIGERALRRLGRLDSVACAAEGGEEGVTLIVDLLPAGSLECFAEDALLLPQHLCISLPAQRSQKAGRSFDIREDERDGSVREIRHRSGPPPSAPQG